MKKTIFKVAYTASIAFCLTILSVRASTRESALVTKVEDGDTIKVLLLETKTEATVRLTDIDAPEVGHGQSRPGQPFGRKAHAAMSQMLNRKYVDLECYPGETYGRRICRVFVDGVDAGENLVAMGLAWAYRDNPRYVRDKRIYSVEEGAHKSRLGLWGFAQSIPPWDWRRACWQLQECPSGEDL